MKEKYTFWERRTDELAAWMGSWTFIFQMSCTLIIYFMVNIYCAWAFDKYPFIFLNLGFSIFACFQAPIIIMAQNRQAYLDKLRDDMDFKFDKDTNKRVKLLESKIMVLEEKIDLIVELTSRKR